jgi:glycine dehydrogenase
MFQTEN